MIQSASVGASRNVLQVEFLSESLN